MSDLTSFNCPSCSASLEYDGRSETIRCDYCHSTIIVPDSLKSSSVRQGILGDEVPEMGNSVHDILILLQNGRKIEAIKLYREAFGVGLKEAKDAVEHLEHGEPTVIHISSLTSTATTGAAASSGCGCGLTFFILLFTFGILAAVFWINSPEQAESILDNVLAGDFEAIAESVETASESVTESVVTLNRQPFNAVVATTQGGDGIAPDLLMENWQYGGQEIPILLSYTAANRENGRRDVRWDVEVATTDNSQSFNFGFDSQNVYITTGNVLKAYGRSNGAELWQVNLSDQVTRLCEHCIRSKDGVVVVFTDDNSLFAIDATTGQQLWQARLEESSYPYVDDGQFTFAFIDGKVAILDDIEIDERATPVLSLYDSQTGELTNQLLPTCPDPDNFFPDDNLGHNGQVFINENTNDLYFIFGSGIVDLLCVQKWDVASGAMVWGTRLGEDVGLPFAVNGGITTPDSRSPYFIMDDTRLLMAADTAVSNESLIQIDLTTGESIFQLGNEDYELVPLGMQEDIIFAGALRTRGSDQTEIWGLDPATAVPVWQHVLQVEDTWTANVTNNDLYLIQVLEDNTSPQLVTQQISPTDGTLIYETSAPLADDRLRGITWTRDFAYLTTQSLIEIDLSDGTETAVWP